MSGTRTMRGLVLAGVVAALVGCGAPEHTFVSSPEADLVLKLPRSWSAVRNETSSNAATGRPDGGWSAVFDASRQPDAKRVDLFSAARDPVAYARVTVLEGEAATSMNGDKLRNMVLPFTAAARAEVGDPRVKTFRQISDFDVRSSVASGVHVVYSYDLGNGREVFDLTAMVGSQRSRAYMLVVRCDQACYDRHRREITEVVSSFTVKVP